MNHHPPTPEDNIIRPTTPYPQHIADALHLYQSVSEHPAIADVLAERNRQIAGEGFLPERDDNYRDGELILAAACYAVEVIADASHYTGRRTDPWIASDMWRALWPWNPHWFKPGQPRRDLVKAAALIIAEIERLDRAARREATG